MLDRIKLKKSIEKVYGRLTRLSLTMYECVGMIAFNHLEKIKMMDELRDSLALQQREINRIHSTILDVVETLQEESELAHSIRSLPKDMTNLAKQSSISLEQAHNLMVKEEQNSSDIWRTLHGDKVLLNESIRALGKSIKKEEPPLLSEQERRRDELMKDISIMIQKKEGNQFNK